MSQLPVNYFNTIAKLKAQIKQSRIKAALKANEVLLDLYWEIGQTILFMQQQEGWGAKLIDKIAVDLKTDFADFKGLSVRNLKYMEAFAKAFPLFGQQVATQLQNTGYQYVEFVQALPAQLSWYHHFTLLDKLKKTEVRMFHIQQTIQNELSRDLKSNIPRIATTIKGIK